MMSWKFKIDDIIVWPADLFWDRPTIAKIVNRKNWSFEYYLLYLDGSSGWRCKRLIEKNYRKFKMPEEFFDLFMIGE